MRKGEHGDRHWQMLQSNRRQGEGNKGAMNIDIADRKNR
jgi:hypothetical protein